ncbi:MAG: hypothetical protein ACYSW3_30175 [Planctomycetota bacterium]|jgi:hypothetical protein
MQIKINIPDQYEERDIFIFAGIDIVARRFKHNGAWEVKEQNCARCGECCKKMTGKSFPFSSPAGCTHLIMSGNEYLCGLSYYRPNGCAVAELDLPQCKVKWKTIK